MKTVLFYHVYLDDGGNWAHIVNEQMSCVENAGLFDAIDEMYVTCVSNDYHKTKLFCFMMISYFKKVNIEEVKSPFANDIELINSYPNYIKDNSYQKHSEIYTLSKIYNMSQSNDMKLLYIHTKGIVSNKLENYKFCKLVYLSRQFLNWAVIENWKKMYDALEKYDIASVNYHSHPAPYYSGNSWWTTSNHIKQLPDPSNIKWWRDLQNSLPIGNPLKSGLSASDRFRIEFWSCSRPNIKLYNLIDINQSDDPLKIEKYRSFYTERKQNEI